jgi:hypothetical protein
MLNVNTKKTASKAVFVTNNSLFSASTIYHIAFTSSVSSACAPCMCHTFFSPPNLKYDYNENKYFFKSTVIGVFSLKSFILFSFGFAQLNLRSFKYYLDESCGRIHRKQPFSRSIYSNG